METRVVSRESGAGSRIAEKGHRLSATERAMDAAAAFQRARSHQDQDQETAVRRLAARLVMTRRLKAPGTRWSGGVRRAAARSLDCKRSRSIRGAIASKEDEGLPGPVTGTFRAGCGPGACAFRP